MIGIIISGHGNFASGLQSALKLISGGFENIEYIDFLETDSVDQLKEKYNDAFNKLSNCNDILALTDLVGGTPFKTLAELSCSSDKNIKVIGGTNLPIAIETAMTKDILDDLNTLVETALNTGKNSIVKFEMVISSHDE